MRLGPSLGLWTVWTVWLRCLWLRSSPRLRCSPCVCRPQALLQEKKLLLLTTNSMYASCC
jgi:hypothetical protein